MSGSVLCVSITPIMNINPTVTMSTREVEIMQACVRVGDGVITKKAAATALEMSTRNFYRRYTAWTNGGEKELVHGNRGKKSNLCLSGRVQGTQRLLL